MQGEPRSQIMPPGNFTPSSDGDEGGLNFGQVLGAIRRRIFIIVGTTLVVSSAAIYKALTDVPIYQAKFEILTEPVTLETQIISATNPETLSNKEEIVAVTVDDVKLKVLTSPQVMTPIIDELRESYPELTYQGLVRSLTVRTTGQKADILEVFYQHPNEEFVNVVLELVSQAFLRYSLEERQSDITQGIEFVEDQLPQLRERVEAQQGRLQNLRQQYNLVDPATAGQQISTQISAFKDQQLNTQLQLDESINLYNDLTQQLSQPSMENAAASILKENARYQSLLSQIRVLDSQIAQESVLFLEESPEIQILQEQRESLLPLLRQEGEQVQRELAGQIRELDARSNVLNNTIERLNLQIKQLSGITREYTDIQRELDIATRNLDQFLSKREALRIDVSQRENPWKILVPPTPPKPSVASAKNSAVLGTILGTIIGLGLALGIDKLRDILYTPAAIKEVTKLPILGVIPFQSNLSESTTEVNVAEWVQQMSSYLDLESNHTTQRYLASPFSEAFRFLHTNLLLLNPDRPISSIVISSAIPAEGKSTTSIHLAQAAAAMGRRVLLVDTDLRRPQLHHRLGLDNQRGLIDVISTENLDFESTIHRSFSEKNLFILTSGFVPPDPIKLIASDRMKKLITKLRSAFDLIIFDAPPLLGFTDSALLGAYTDGIVLVTGLGKIKRSLLSQALEKLKISGVPLLGAVANGSKDASSAVSSYYSRYYNQKSQEKSTIEELKDKSSSPQKFWNFLSQKK